MQWMFLVLALLAALAEMHTGTFYLAGIAAAALLTAGVGFWVSDTYAVYLFVLLCAGVVGAIAVTRRRRMRTQALADFDIGQSVSVLSTTGPDNRIAVRYRGTVWQATMDDGSVPAPNDTATIVAKTDKLLHLVATPKAPGP